jgi:hypothetical protein
MARREWWISRLCSGAKVESVRVLLDWPVADRPDLVLDRCVRHSREGRIKMGGIPIQFPTWYFSFGVDSPMAKYYVPIVAEEEWQARAAMWCLFSQHWCSCYKTMPDTELLLVNYHADIRIQTAHPVDAPQDLYDLGHQVLLDQPAWALK